MTWALAFGVALAACVTTILALRRGRRELASLEQQLRACWGTKSTLTDELLEMRDVLTGAAKELAGLSERMGYEAKRIVIPHVTAHGDPNNVTAEWEEKSKGRTGEPQT